MFLVSMSTNMPTDKKITFSSAQSAFQNPVQSVPIIFLQILRKCQELLFIVYITPLYKFFNKKSIVQDFLMYNEFATTITKESDPVR